MVYFLHLWASFGKTTISESKSAPSPITITIWFWTQYSADYNWPSLSGEIQQNKLHKYSLELVNIKTGL